MGFNNQERDSWNTSSCVEQILPSYDVKVNFFFLLDNSDFSETIFNGSGFPQYHLTSVHEPRYLISPEKHREIWIKDTFRTFWVAPLNVVSLLPEGQVDKHMGRELFIECTLKSD